VVVCPSNPFLSIDPILSLPGVREALRSSRAPVVAVSPIVGGNAVKGPTAKIMAELGLPISAAAVAQHYADILDTYIADDADTDELADLDVPTILTRTLMVTLDDRVALARTVMVAAGRGF
jgi:LPPG:FO 2-phospho-L-lactate transferase